MKHFKFSLPTVVVAALMLFVSCIPSPSLPPNVDTNRIVEEIKSNVADCIAVEVRSQMDEITASLNDTILSATVNGDTIAVASKAVRPELSSVTIKDLTIEVSPGSDKEYYRLQKEHMALSQVIIITIAVFVLILVLSIGALLFFFKRIKSRNEVIFKAIESNYQLPDSFYGTSSDSGVSFEFKYDNRANKESANSGEVSAEAVADGEKKDSVPPVYRNNRNFERGWRNVIVGIAVIIIFNVWRAEAIAVLGIIPLLMGAAQLLTYYKIIKR